MRGAYTVLAISPPKMDVQYENGTQSTLDITMQQRIWERIQDERAVARQEFERKKAVNQPKITFSGLLEDDFKENVAGTNWRSREGLGGLIARQLTDSTGIEFVSGAIYRRPQFFVYPPHLPMYNQQEGVKLPKFVVQLNSEDVLYGFYIEKSDKEMGHDWFWPSFLNICSESKWKKILGQLMSEFGLSWILRFEEKIADSNYYKLSEDTVISSFDSGSYYSSMAEFISFLRNLRENQWCNLYFGKRMGRREAIEMREKISKPISNAFRAISPFYLQLLAAGNRGFD